jgi:hypothetical protein
MDRVQPVRVLVQSYFLPCGWRLGSWGAGGWKVGGLLALTIRVPSCCPLYPPNAPPMPPHLRLLPLPRLINFFLCMWALQMDVGCDYSKLCCCGQRNGSTITLFRCSPTATFFPMACVVGPHWPCIFFTTACIVVPSYFIIAYM